MVNYKDCGHCHVLQALDSCQFDWMIETKFALLKFKVFGIEKTLYNNVL